jgi:HEAT repeats
MLPHVPTAFLAACLTLGSQDPTGQVAPQDQTAQTLDEALVQAEPSALESRVAEILAAARQPKSSGATSVVSQLAQLGDAAAAALLDAYAAEHLVRDPQKPELHLQLTEGERQALAAAVTKLDRGAVCGLAYEALVQPMAPLRTRGLAALELVGRADQIELAVSVAATAEAGSAEESVAQGELERTVAAIARREKAAFAKLRELLPKAKDWIAVGLVRGCASAGGADALTALTDELDRSPQQETLLLSELARAARTAPVPCDARVASEVAERLRSADPAIARAAAGAAGALEDSEALPVLIGLLDASNAGVRESALSALRQISRCTYGPASAAWSVWYERERAWIEQRGSDLERQLASPEPSRVLAALREIAGHKIRRHELAALASRALDNTSSEVRRAACATLAELGSRSCAPRLSERMADEDAQVARAARESLAAVTARSPR